MAGVIGIAYKKENCIEDLKKGLHYLQHRAQDYCGLASFDGEKIKNITHEGKVLGSFSEIELKNLNGFYGIGSVANDEQPVSSYSSLGEMAICFDGNIINHINLREKFVKEGASFIGFSNPSEVKNIDLISKIISKENSFEKGIERLIEKIEGDFSIVALMEDSIYAARGWGRKPLILGENEKGYAVASESNSFLNICPPFKIIRDVKPGEVVQLNKYGINTLKELNVQPIQYGTFEWIYTAYPASIIDGKPVSEARKNLGILLAKKYNNIKADLVSPVPNSGRWHAIGYAKESKIPYEEVFARYDYSDRSFTPSKQEERDKVAKMKLLPIVNSIRGKKIILVDDSIVRGTQTLNQVNRLKEFGVEEVHLMIACPPLMCACKYGDTTKKDEDCIARGLSIEKIREKLDVDSLNYADISMLEEAIGISREKLCLTCWGSDKRF